MILRRRKSAPAKPASSPLPASLTLIIEDAWDAVNRCESKLRQGNFTADRLLAIA